MTYKDVKAAQSAEAAKDLINVLNAFSFDNESFASEVLASHRTLQQSAFRVFIACIEKWAEAYESGCYDLRNEQTAKLSHAMWNDYLKDNNVVPFI